MRFIVMHKQDKDSEAGVPPSRELMAGMGEFIAEGMKSGVFLSGEGLQPSSKRARLNFAGGRRTVSNWPFTGSNEPIAGLAMVRVKSKEDAIEWASRFAELVGDVEIEVGQVKEPWDVGLCPKPEQEVSIRFLLMHKAGKNSEAGVPPTPKLMAEIGKLTEEMRKAGVFLFAERLQPSSKGARLTFSGGKRTVIDGPFTESKELIGGFATLQVKSKEEAIEWAKRFAKVLYDGKVVGDIEVDVLEMHEAPDFV
jgi:hypothetical protein